MQFALFFLPYLALPILLSVLVRILRLERWRFMTYVLSVALLFSWPSLWMELRFPDDAPLDGYRCGLPAIAELSLWAINAVFLVPLVMLVQLLSNLTITRYGHI